MADQEDQGLSQADIDAAMAANATEPASNTPDENQGLSQTDIDAAMAGADNATEATGDTPDENSELSQADIGAALAGNAIPPSQGTNQPDESSPGSDPSQGLTQEDIDAALAGVDAGPGTTDPAPPDAAETSDERLDSTGKPFDEIAAAMAAEIEEAAANQSATANASATEALGAVPLDIPVLDDGGSSSASRDLSKDIEMLHDVALDVKIELGRTEKTVEEVLQLSQGSVVELDRLAGDPVDILVNDRLVARGEVLVLNDNLCVRVSEILTRQKDARYG